jgi:hypothetical protein
MSYSLRCLRLAPAADRKSSAAASGIPSAGCLAFARKRMNSGKHGSTRPVQLPQTPGELAGHPVVLVLQLSPRFAYGIGQACSPLARLLSEVRYLQCIDRIGLRLACKDLPSALRRRHLSGTSWPIFFIVGSPRRGRQVGKRILTFLRRSSPFILGFLTPPHTFSTFFRRRGQRR